MDAVAALEEGWAMEPRGGAEAVARVKLEVVGSERSAPVTLHRRPP